MTKIATTSEPTLKVEAPEDLLLILLFAPGADNTPEPIEGVTKLQKLMFLLGQGKGPTALVEQAKNFDHKPYKMGPFSPELRDVVDELKSAGIIRTTRLSYRLTDDLDDPSGSDEYETSAARQVESFRFALTRRGEEIANELWNSLSNDSQKELIEFKRFFNSLSLRQLLIFVYERFPSFTSKSEIKDQLGL